MNEKMKKIKTKETEEKLSKCITFVRVCRVIQIKIYLHDEIRMKNKYEIIPPLQYVKIFIFF